MGARPTRDGFSRLLQNDVIHKFRGLTPVPVGATREATDLMFSGSFTRWTGLFSKQEDGFVGLGTAAGSLYDEPYVHFGVWRLSLADLTRAGLGAAPAWRESGSDYLRLAAMARDGRSFGSAAFRDVAPQSSLAQVSISFGHDRPTRRPGNSNWPSRWTRGSSWITGAMRWKSGLPPWRYAAWSLEA